MLPLSPGTGGGGFKLAIDRDAIHLIISKHLLKKIGMLLIWWSDFIMTYSNEYTGCVQMQVLCLDEISDELDQAKSRGLPLQGEPWSRLKKIREKRQSIYDQFLLILANERRASIEIKAQSTCYENEVDNDSDTITLHTLTTQALLKYSRERFFKTPLRVKRENISHAMKFHRVLSLCKGKQYACEALDMEMNRIEKHRETHIYDARRRKMLYCINKKGQVFPRLWLWATESVEEDGESYFLAFMHYVALLANIY